MRRKSEFFISICHIFMLCSFAFAQPLFDLLARHAAFLAVHKAGPLDILGLVCILCLLIPSGFVCLELIGRACGQGMQKSVHAALVAVLVAVLSLSALKTVGEVSGIYLVAAAAAAGIGISACYVRFVPVRMFWTALTPVVFLFPGLFLFRAPISQFVFGTIEDRSAMAIVRNPAPVVLVVFDEFPLISLLDENYHIDAVRYPNFAALAHDATWFRNASTVSPSTVHAVPAILSGMYPNKSWLPTTADYPHNLFTLLQGTYQMQIFESHTMLCPETVCLDGEQRQTALQRFSSLLQDVAMVYLHVILPRDLTHSLPVVTQTWKDFGKEETKPDPTLDEVRNKALKAYVNRGARFAEFVARFSQTDKPIFSFLHLLLPHVPWEYLPTGRIYTQSGMPIPGLNIKTEIWGEDEGLAVQGYQRHLLQVGFVDTLLGDLMRRLRTLGLYDQSLIVVTADHGASFWVNASRRSVAGPHPGDIRRVPLFIKAPYQRMGHMSDRPVKTIDILPTIADVLGINLPWSVDGSSIYSLTVICSDGLVIPVVSETVLGYVDYVTPAEGQTTVFGWAADIRHSDAAKRILIFADGKLIHDGPTNTERPDVVRVYKDAGILQAGFHYTLSASILNPSSVADLRVFAISHQDVASELRYPEGSEWQGKRKSPPSLPAFDPLKQPCLQRQTKDAPHSTFLAMTHGLAGDVPEAFIEKTVRPELNASLTPVQASLERKLALFGNGKHGSRVFTMSRYQALVGQSLDQLSIVGASSLHATLDLTQQRFDVQSPVRFVPAHITGTLTAGAERVAEQDILAVAINGTIQDVMPCFLGPQEKERFSLLVPENAFQIGPNEPAFFLISGQETAPQLERVNFSWRPVN